MIANNFGFDTVVAALSFANVRHAAAALPYGPFQYDEIECGAHGQVERPGALSIGRSTGIFILAN